MRESPSVVIGLDVSDKQTHVFALDFETGEVLEDGKLATSGRMLGQRFRGYTAARVVVEAGMHSRWISELLGELGHEVLVANPRRVRLIAESDRKNDRFDAEMLARLGRSDPRLLSPIRHRSAAAQADLAVIRARDALVEMRTKLVNHVRGTVKGHGARLPACDAAAFHRQAREHIPAALVPALEPLLAQVESLTGAIRTYDKLVKKTAEDRYPEVKVLQQVAGVGPLTSLAFVLTLEDPHRFRSGRAVGAFLGLVPRQRESGEDAPELRITKAGNSYLRRLLVGSAHYVLGHFGPDTDLRRWGLKLAGRGGKRAKKRAVVAVARKLAVLLYTLWVTSAEYVPLRGSGQQSPGTEAVGAASASSAS